MPSVMVLLVVRRSVAATTDNTPEAAFADFIQPRMVGQFFMKNRNGLISQLGNGLTSVLRMSLIERYGVPPFSVLDARQAYWKIRKQRWLNLGIKSELGRGSELISDAGGSAVYGGSSDWAGNRGPSVSPGGSPRPACSRGADGRTRRGDGSGRPLGETYGSGRPGDLSAGFKSKQKNGAIPGGGTGANSAYLFKTDKGYDKGADAQEQGTGTSIFDPVLCELAYTWFCPPGGAILDPFAGGSVRGVVANYLGYNYTGIDLSDRQLKSNRSQARAILPPGRRPRWITGDSMDVKKLAPGEYDFIFSCPPYFDLEVYSNNPSDLSTMPTDKFVVSYSKIIKRCLDLLKPDRFACFVVGNSRGKDHCYTHLPWHTTKAFEDCGALLYNDAVLVTAIGSLPLRVGRQFKAARKLGRTHQSVLVFVKGSYKKASAAIGLGGADEEELQD